MALLSPPHLLDGARWAHKRIGLFGGSFNPPHAGHVHASLTAAKFLGLDYVWWLVSPHNPLKDAAALADYDSRLRLCRELVAPFPQIIVSDIERTVGRNRTYDVVRVLKNRFTQTSFVLLTGMDNAATFHRWYRWRDIKSLIATAHIARPPASNLAQACPLSQCPRANQHVLSRPARPALAPGDTFWILENLLLDISSTEIRKNI